ncbi:hypothetical protein [Fusibacter sp. 3D3]|uniref:hypothetical protein n=1 Tax=Fusibacter sp. 3D3 TaxID=1048380 RepID=UPI0008533488|nr:hypothetical protein [Fusibacter sp. 3D3]GAU79746.1 hypothetical protein F3D3_4411 [Fusibacter sp. 3D3]
MKLKTVLLTGLMFLLTAGIIFAATPSEIITDLTGMTADQVIELHSTGITYGQIAQDNGVLDAYQEATLAEKIALINERVADGTYTRAQADAYITQLTDNQANCDPSNPDRIMSGTGLRFGGGKGAGLGNGANCATPGTGGYGRANGMGFGRTQTTN